MLYGVREHTPTLADYWWLPDTHSERIALETPSPEVVAPTGVIHRRRKSPLADYSLYVPESYTPDRSWPLIVCLHGAYGRGDHFIWSWLRPAKSRGYMLLAPKSVDVTWSILQPERDARSVLGMLEEVCAEYAVDRSRIFISGLSDGGTYTYLLGLSRPELFAGIAPVAGDMHGLMDDMLRERTGNQPAHLHRPRRPRPYFPGRHHTQRARSADPPGLQGGVRGTARLGTFQSLGGPRSAGDAVVRELSWTLTSVIRVCTDGSDWERCAQHGSHSTKSQSKSEQSRLDDTCLLPSLVTRL